MTEHPESTGHAPYTCLLCGEQNPRWRLDRRGDAVVVWACTDHLVPVLLDTLPANEHRDQATVTDLHNSTRAEAL